MGELYDPAMRLVTEISARAYLDQLVEWTMDRAHNDLTEEEARLIHLTNIGYWAGYYNHETRERVERLFNTTHPVFGGIAKNGPPSPSEALQAGLKMGKEISECGSTRNQD